MAVITWIQSGELAVGQGHPTLPDTANRPLRELITQSGGDPDSATLKVAVDPFLVSGSTTARSFSVRFSDVVNVLDHGADNTGVAVCRTAVATAISKLPTAGGVLLFPPGSYNLGDFTVADYHGFQFFNSAGSPRRNIRVLAYGAYFSWSTTEFPCIPRIVEVTDPDGFWWSGGKFQDLASDISVDWKGADVFQIISNTTATVGRVRIEDVHAIDCDSLAVVNGVSYHTTRIRDVHIQGVAERCYYGVVLQENGDAARINLLSLDSRRPLFVYGVTDVNADISVVDSVVSPSSNAALMIKRYQRDTKRLTIRATFQGIGNKHTVAARLEMQPTVTGTGLMEDIDINLSYIDMTSCSMIPMQFSSIDQDGNLELTTTDNHWENIRLRGNFTGFTGQQSVNMTVTQNVLGKLHIDQSIDKWMIANRVSFPGFNVSRGPNKYLRTFTGDLTAAAFTFPMDWLNSRQFTIKARISLLDDYGHLASQNSHYQEDVLFADNASAGAVAVISTGNICTLSQGTGPSSVTWGGSGENLTLTIAGATYSGANAYMTVELEFVHLISAA